MKARLIKKNTAAPEQYAEVAQCFSEQYAASAQATRVKESTILTMRETWLRDAEQARLEQMRSDRLTFAL